MARRSSARIQARQSATPQPRKVSNFDYDGGFQTPRTAPRLTALNESDEMPGAFPRSASPVNDTPTKLAAHIAKVTAGQMTPRNVTPIRPSAEEMHPKHYQTSTAKPLEEARWLGFSSMGPHTGPPKGIDKLIPAVGTPSKTPKVESTVKSPEYQFTFRAQSLELSNEAREMMAAKRGEAAKIKEQMVKDAEDASKLEAVAASRRMATPKSKVGRFSDVHMAEFKKMDSIASHASVARPAEHVSLPTASSSLKRTISKTDLAQSGPGGSKSQKPAPANTGKLASSLPRSASVKSLQRCAEESSSPAKRVKRAADDDAGTSRPTVASSSEGTPSTPKGSTHLRQPTNIPHFATTPTQSSLARASSVKSIKTSKLPSLNRSPSKTALRPSVVGPAKPSTPLLARSPTKMTLPSPTKHVATTKESPLLSRSPSRPKAGDHTAEVKSEEAIPSTHIPFLARSPTKSGVLEHHGSDEQSSKTPLLARSPAKMTAEMNPFAPEATPAKSASTKLMDRFKFLRASPVKSILRSPQRLYSDDPIKVANGTHFATPPKAGSVLNRALPNVPKTAPVQKHVYFTASTKGDNDGEYEPPTPSKGPTPTRDSNTDKPQPMFSYPALPSEHDTAPTTIKKFNRRMTLGANTPGDFTFRVGAGVAFSTSPRSNNSISSKPSIRHVSADPEIIPSQAAKKRKLFDFSSVSDAKSSKPTHDKENDAESSSEETHRPAKKSRTNGPEITSIKTVEKPKSATRLPTLGVKPKAPAGQKPKDRRPSMLSQARLNALAKPKRR